MPFDSDMQINFGPLPASHRRLAEDGRQKYALGLQNMFLAVREYSLTGIGWTCPLPSTEVSAHTRDARRFFDTIGVYSMGRLQSEMQRVDVEQRLMSVFEDTAENYIRYQFPGILGVVNFNLERAKDSFDASKLRHSEFARAIDCQMRRAEKFMRILFDCSRNPRNCTSTELIQLDGFVQEMAQHGSIANVSFEETNKEVDDKVSRLAELITNEKLREAQSETIASITLNGEAALGAVISSDFEVALVHFRTAVSILEGMVKPTTATKPVMMRIVKSRNSDAERTRHYLMYGADGQISRRGDS